MIHEIEPLEPRREIALLQGGEVVPLKVRGVVMFEDRTVLLLQEADETDVELTCQLCGMPGRTTGGVYPFVPAEVIHVGTGLVECSLPSVLTVTPSLPGRRSVGIESGRGSVEAGQYPALPPPAQQRRLDGPGPAPPGR